MKNLIDSGPQYQWLDGGKRLHLQHGPIDLVIEACGKRESVARAYQQAHEVFQTVLSELVGELEHLRKPLTGSSCKPEGLVASRMYRAAWRCRQVDTITPMIAVAGSVADHVLQSMLSVASLERAYVNNGGDIALWLAPEQTFTIGICENTETRRISADITLQALHGVHGVATSGWHGRSHSLGIADAVTVLASSAADADTMATLIANAVDIPDSPCVHREPAFELSPDTDLGERLVTVAVDTLSDDEVAQALERGSARAEQMRAMPHFSAAYISLAGRTIVCGSTQQILCAGVMYA